jgi:hypothetical protein
MTGLPLQCLLSLEGLSKALAGLLCLASLIVRPWSFLHWRSLCLPTTQIIAFLMMEPQTKLMACWVMPMGHQ